MFGKEHTYSNEMLKSYVKAFGALFSNIYIERLNTSGDVAGKIFLPISFAQKEKWFVRTTQDPEQDNYIFNNLPRMDYEITGYTYDSQRAVSKMNYIQKRGVDGKAMTVSAPVPYNIDITANLLTKTRIDSYNILEQINSVFTPDYPLKLKLLRGTKEEPGMNLELDAPVILNSVTESDEYQGDFQTRRITHFTLSFIMKTYIFRKVDVDKNLIKTITVSIDDKELSGGDGDAAETIKMTGKDVTDDKKYFNDDGNPKDGINIISKGGRKILVTEE